MSGIFQIVLKTKLPDADEPHRMKMSYDSFYNTKDLRGISLKHLIMRWWNVRRIKIVPKRNFYVWDSEFPQTANNALQRAPLVMVCYIILEMRFWNISVLQWAFHLWDVQKEAWLLCFPMSSVLPRLDALWVGCSAITHYRFGQEFLYVSSFQTKQYNGWTEFMIFLPNKLELYLSPCAGQAEGRDILWVLWSNAQLNI